jgi:peptidoglycan/LPS O-acetylase OafA/YrhL
VLHGSHFVLAKQGQFGPLNLGVDFFMVLSGFIMMHVYGEALGRISLRKSLEFYQLRIARTYPLLIVTTTAIAILYLGGVAAGQPMRPLRFDPAELAANYLMLFIPLGAADAPWNYPAWSLSAEYWCYAAFPLIAWAFWRSRAVQALAMLAGLACVAWAFLAHPKDVFLIKGWPALIRCGAEFLIGCALQSLVMATRGEAMVRKLLILAIGLAAALPLLFLVHYPMGVVMLVATLILAVCYLLPHDLPASPVVDAGVWLGEHSYSIYLCHPVIHFMMVTLLGFRERSPFITKPIDAGPQTTWWLHDVLWFALFLGASFALAVLAHRIVEQPARRLLRPAPWQRSQG